ncbi:hypothetical protein [Brevibacillus gelatini]|nr:hypothetical protein [Brevibacillus gelatini]
MEIISSSKPRGHLAFHLLSERALDAMNLCGNRGRLSKGNLPAERVYQSSNKEEIRLQLPFIDGKYEEITQNDLDVLRAITTHYAEIKEIHCPFATPDPTEWVDESLSGAQLKIVDSSDIFDLWHDGKAIAIGITPEQIRKRLGNVTNKQLPTTTITRSLQRLSQMRVEGIYKVRSEKGTLDVPINGTLLHFEIGTGSNRSIVYNIYFATQWGRLYLHNVQWGNLIRIYTPDYLILSNGAKNLFMTVMVFPNPVFIRREDTLLSMLGIKIGKNRNRAVQNLVRYADELEQHQFITWQCKNGTYTIGPYHCSRNRSKRRSRLVRSEPSYDRMG